MESENFKADFLKWPPPHMKPSKTRHVHIYWSINVI